MAARKKKDGLFQEGSFPKSEAPERFRQFASSRDVQVVLFALASLLEIPESFKKSNEFETIWAAAQYEGEKSLLDKFTSLVNSALSGKLDDLKTLDKNGR